jgi:hypothetical protein
MQQRRALCGPGHPGMLQVRTAKRDTGGDLQDARTRRANPEKPKRTQKELCQKDRRSIASPDEKGHRNTRVFASTNLKLPLDSLRKVHVLPSGRDLNLTPSDIDFQIYRAVELVVIRRVDNVVYI